MCEISWLDVIQSIGVIIASGGVIVTLFLTFREMHKRSGEQKFQSYLVGMRGFVDLARLLVEKPELQSLYEYSDVDLAKTYEQMSPDERAKVHYCDTIIALCEPVWLAHHKKLLEKDEWPFWERWAKDLNKSPYFRWTLQWVAGEYDPLFLAALRGDDKPDANRTA